MTLFYFGQTLSAGYNSFEAFNFGETAMKEKIPTIVRVILGLIFVTFGLNGFLNFIPMPPPPPEAGSFMISLAASKYFLPVLKLTEIICGIAFLSGMFVPLALVVLAPISIQILLFHIFLAPGLQGMVMAIFIIAANIFLGYAYRESFKGVLNMTAKARL